MKEDAVQREDPSSLAAEKWTARTWLKASLLAIGTILLTLVFSTWVRLQTIGGCDDPATISSLRLARALFGAQVLAVSIVWLALAWHARKGQLIGFLAVCLLYPVWGLVDAVRASTTEWSGGFCF